MKRITAALLFFLTIPSYAGAQTRTVTRDIPFQAFLFSCPEIGGAFPEEYALVGTENYAFAINDKADLKTVEVRRSSIKGKAVGMTTGTEYNFHIQSKSRFVFSLESENPVEMIGHGSFIIPSLGFKILSEGHVEYGKDGEIKAEITNLRVDCPITTP